MENMQERRIEHRHKVLKAGKIVHGAQNCLYDCRIKDMTAHGARLKVEHGWQVPKNFNFIDTMRAKIQRPSRVVWRGETEVGIAFEDAA